MAGPTYQCLVWHSNPDAPLTQTMLKLTPVALLVDIHSSWCGDHTPEEDHIPSLTHSYLFEALVYLALTVPLWSIWQAMLCVTCLPKFSFQHMGEMTIT